MSKQPKIVLSKATVKGKKFTAKLYDEDGKYKKMFHFGADGYQDYTMHGDLGRKHNYIARHSNEDYSSINPGSLSRYLLWNKPTLYASIKDFEKRYNVKITIN
jgi:hypothetical protein